MQTSAAGSNRACRGFTLLELLLVISIMALAVAGVSVALPDSRQAALEREAVRLASLLEAARAHARASGRAVRWKPLEAGGFRFEGLPPAARMPSGWQHPAIVVRSVDALILGPEPILPAQGVTLALRDAPGIAALRVATDGLRPFAVEP